MKLKYLIREYKWATTPILYILLIVIVSLIYTNKNSNHDIIPNKKNIIDGTSIGSQISLAQIHSFLFAIMMLVGSMGNIQFGVK